jgi:hypothetical protein
MLNVNGIDAFLRHVMASAGTYPLTLFARARQASGGANQVVFSEVQIAAGRRCRAAAFQNAAGSAVEAIALSSWGATPQASAGENLGDAAGGAAEPVMLVATSATSMTLYTANNPSGVTGTGTNASASDWAGADTLLFGARYFDSVYGDFFNGALGELARWSAALDAADFAALAAGAYPETRRPVALYDVWDGNPPGAAGSAVTGPLIGRINGRSLSVVGAVTKSSVPHPVARDSSWTPLGSVKTAGNTASATTAAVDTTGAKLIVVVASCAAGGVPGVVDSVHGGTGWNEIVLGASSANKVVLFWRINPTTSATHTFTVGGPTYFGVAHIMWFGNTAGVVGVDVQASNSSASAATLAAGSVTPAYTNSLVIAAAAAGGASGSFSIGSGFTIPANGQSPGIDSTSMAGMIAYLIQSAAASVNPTVTMPVTGACATGTVVFRATDGAGSGDTTPPTLSGPSGTGGLGVCTGSVSTNEAAGDLYAVATASATAPTQLQVRNGQDHTGAAALRVRSQAVTSTGAQSIPSGAISGGAGTRYWHFMHEDAAGNRSAVVSSAGFSVTASATQLVVTVPDAAGLSGFNAVVLSAAAPGAGVTVIATATGITFNGSGQATISIAGLGVPVTAYRWVTVTNATGDPLQSPPPVQAQGPVQAS